MTEKIRRFCRKDIEKLVARENITLLQLFKSGRMMGYGHRMELRKMIRENYNYNMTEIREMDRKIQKKRKRANI